jgi:16S rRNA (adenine1518-N6/adenine1519-N6)-dimethyltransferase
MKGLRKLSEFFLKKYGIALKPESDQHFMIDRKAIEKMIEVSKIKPDDLIIEIGTGIGNLTKYLIERKAKVITIEIDRQFEPILRERFKGNKNLEIVFGNGLEMIRKKRKKFNKIVSNIPYALCEPLFNELIRKKFDFAVLTIPEGFFRRLKAKPSDKTFSILSLKIQSFFDIELILKISKESFYPQPNTSSVMIKLERIPKSKYKENPMKYVSKELFLQKTKKLKNALMESLINLNKDIFGRNFTKRESRSLIRKLGFKEGLLEKRIESMNLDDFLFVFKKLKSIL